MMTLVYFIIMITLAVYGIIKLYNIHKSIVLYSRIAIWEKLILLGVISFFIFLSFRYKIDIFGYIILLFLLLFVIMDSTGNGIANNGIASMRRRRLYQKEPNIRFDEIKLIKLYIDKDIRLETSTKRAMIILRFKLDDRERLLELLSNVNIRIMDNNI